jgi:hypothetical protein
MAIYGRRQPINGRAGIYMSVWMNTEDLAALDSLSRYWGLNRSQTMKRAVADMNAENIRFKRGPRQATHKKGTHRQPRRMKRLEG